VRWLMLLALAGCGEGSTTPPAELTSAGASEGREEEAPGGGADECVAIAPGQLVVVARPEALFVGGPGRSPIRTRDAAAASRWENLRVVLDAVDVSAATTVWLVADGYDTEATADADRTRLATLVSDLGLAAQPVCDSRATEIASAFAPTTPRPPHDPVEANGPVDPSREPVEANGPVEATEPLGHQSADDGERRLCVDAPPTLNVSRVGVNSSTRVLNPPSGYEHYEVFKTNDWIQLIAFRHDPPRRLDPPVEPRRPRWRIARGAGGLAEARGHVVVGREDLLVICLGHASSDVGAACEQVRWSWCDGP